MKTIKPVAVLEYYDGAQIFEGRDSIGGHYVAMLIDRVSNGVFRYLATGANPERLRQFRVRDLDLLTLLLEAPDGEWFFVYGDPLYGEPLTLVPQEGALAEQDDLLPGPNLILDDGPFDDIARTLARESNNTVMEFSVEPPETARGHRVRVYTLGEVLTQIQTVVRHAYRRATSLLSLPDTDTEDGYLMDVVVPAAPGSLRVILEAAAPIGETTSPRMFNQGELVRALELMDKVFQSADDPDKAQEILMEHKGHLAGSYIKLLGILADKDTGFNYSWADPLMPRSHYHGVSAPVAKKLYETFSENVELRTEEVSLEGEFVQMDLDPGKWGLRVGKSIKRGETKEGGPSLKGLPAGNRYRFHCIDEIEINAMGRENHTLYLQKIEPVSENPDDNPDAHSDVQSSMVIT